MNLPSIRLFCRIAVIVLSFCGLSLAAQEEEEPDPYEWVIDSYSFPIYDLVHGFATEERGALRAPALPDGEMTEEERLDFLKKSNSVVSHYLKEQGLALPEGSVVVFDPESLTLAARAPRITQASIHFTSASFRERTETYVELNTVLLEGPSDLIRAQFSLASEEADHSGILARLEEEADQGAVTILQRRRAETRSGQRTRVEDARESIMAGEVELTPDGLLLYESDTTKEGTTWEFDVVVGADRETIDLNLSLQHHFAPTYRRQVVFAKTEKGILSAPVSEASVATVNSQFTMWNGYTKMVGVWKPNSVLGDPAAGDSLQVGFVSADLVEVLPLLNRDLVDLLERHADAIAKIPEGKPIFEKVADEIPEGMIVRRFRIPPTFLRMGSSGIAGGGGAAADPFADPVSNEPTFTVRATAKDILMSAGISFPEGSSANYLAPNSTLVVRNTPEQIALVEAYVMSIVSGVEKTIGLTAYVVEGPADVIRAAVSETRGLANHVEAWESLAADEAITHLSSHWIEARSGQRSVLQATKDFHYPVSNHVVVEGTAEKSNQSPEGSLSGAFESREIGTKIEVDPVLGADEHTIDLMVSFSASYAMPTTTAEPEREGQEIALEGPATHFHDAKLISATTMRDGMMRLVGFWKPEGAARFEQADLLQALFLKADIIRLREEE